MNRLVAILLLLAACSACTVQYPNRDPLGELFPKVGARSLSGEEITLPDSFSGKKVVLLVAYVQDAQFDVDRWMLGLAQLKTDVLVAEIPTIQGFFPRLISRRIDRGMRSGIPKEDWGIVYTVYEDAKIIAEFLGNESPRKTRVLLLSAEGRVVWFYDRGYSAARVQELDAKVRSP